MYTFNDLPIECTHSIVCVTFNTTSTFNTTYIFYIISNGDVHTNTSNPIQKFILSLLKQFKFYLRDYKTEIKYFMEEQYVPYLQIIQIQILKTTMYTHDTTF